MFSAQDEKIGPATKPSIVGQAVQNELSKVRAIQQFDDLPKATYSNEGRSAQTQITPQSPAAVTVPQNPLAAVRAEPAQGAPVQQRGRDANGVITNQSVSDLYSKDGGLAGMKPGQFYATMDMKGGNDTLARSLGYGSAADFMSQKNAEQNQPQVVYAAPEQKNENASAMMDKFNSLADEAKRSGRGGQRILAEYGNLVRAQMANDAQMNQASMSAERAAGHDRVLMRGQDIQAKNELMRLQGNPLDAETKRLQLDGIKRTSSLQDAYVNAKTPEERNAAAQTIAALTGKQPDYKDRYITLPNRKVYNEMGQVTGEEPGGIFDAATGTTVGQKQEKQGGAPAFNSVAEVNAAKAAGKLKTGDVIQTPNGLMTVR